MSDASEIGGEPRNKSGSVGSKKPPAAKKRPKKRSKGLSPEVKRTAAENVSRAEALAALYRPLQEAGERELKKTKAGRKILEATDQLGRSLEKLYEGVKTGATSAEEVELLVRERQKAFRERHGEQLMEVEGRHAHLQPSVEAVARIVRPEHGANTPWVSETSPFRSMLLQPKAPPTDVATISAGLGTPVPPIVQSCAMPPYEFREVHFLLPPFVNDPPAGGADASVTNGVTEAMGRTLTVGLVVHTEVALASAFVGQDFPVPKGPTNYTARIHYDWQCNGWGYACLGVTIINVNLAIVIDKLDGTRETFAEEVSLFSVPVIGGDIFHHESPDAIVTIPFMRNGLNGTTRIYAGVDGHCATVALFGGGRFYGRATIREICLNSDG